jgi:hypothetical protein
MSRAKSNLLGRNKPDPLRLNPLLTIPIRESTMNVARILHAAVAVTIGTITASCVSEPETAEIHEDVTSDERDQALDGVPRECETSEGVQIQSFDQDVGPDTDVINASGACYTTSGSSFVGQNVCNVLWGKLALYCGMSGVASYGKCYCTCNAINWCTCNTSVCCK